MEEEKKTFAYNLCRIMNEKNIGEIELTKKLGIHPRTMKKYINGEVLPVKRTAIKLLDVLGCSVDELFKEP